MFKIEEDTGHCFNLNRDKTPFSERETFRDTVPSKPITQFIIIIFGPLAVKCTIKMLLFQGWMQTGMKIELSPKGRIIFYFANKTVKMNLYVL